MEEEKEVDEEAILREWLQNEHLNLNPGST